METLKERIIRMIQILTPAQLLVLHQFLDQLQAQQENPELAPVQDPKETKPSQ